jgi:hypothetical protein
MSRLMIATALSPILLLAFTAQAQTTVGQPAQPAPERRICRAMEQPGSLAGSRRVCMTRAEWDRLAENARRTGEMMTAGQDSCAARAEGGSAINSGSFSQQNQAAMQRSLSGC